MLTHFSLFTGSGAVDFAGEWAGFKTVGMCEKDKFCQEILKLRFPGVPIWGDIKDVTAESVRDAGIGRIDLLTGGDPCQPHSVAGKRRGREDDRFLWPEMLRVISELRPAWVVNENVTGSISNMVLDDKILDLEAIGYETGPPLVIPACAIGAPHERFRVFLVAHSKCA